MKPTVFEPATGICGHPPYLLIQYHVPVLY